MTQTRRSILPAQRHVLRLASAAASAALAFAAASSASAGGDQAIRITADIPVAGFVHAFYPSGPSQTVGLIGIPSGTFFSFYGASIPVGVGYLFRKNLYVGARFAFQTYFPDGGDAIFSGRFSGRFEYVFGGGGDKVRPFVGADLGLTAISVPSFPGNQTYGGFIGSGSGGVHIFLADSFTLSPYGELAFQRFFDNDQNSVSLVFGAVLGGWIWR
jgi:hypothetical protein